MINADTVEKWVIGKFFYYYTGKITVLNTGIEEAAGNFNPKNSGDADLTVHHHHPHLQKVIDPEIEGTYL